MAGGEFMLFRAPRPASLPHVETMLNSLGNDRTVAKFLGVTEATVRKYRRQGQAPRAVMLALFWETPWGASAADCVAINDARQAYAKARILERENKVLKDQIQALEALLSNAGSLAANEHFYAVGRK